MYVVTDYNVCCLNCMGYLFESEVYSGGGDFGGPVTEGGSHAKKVGDHCPKQNLTNEDQP